MEYTFDLVAMLQVLITGLMLYFFKANREESKENVKLMQKLATAVELHDYQITELKNKSSGHCCETG